MQAKPELCLHPGLKRYILRDVISTDGVSGYNHRCDAVVLESIARLQGQIHIDGFCLGRSVGIVILERDLSDESIIAALDRQPGGIRQGVICHDRKVIVLGRQSIGT